MLAAVTPLAQYFVSLRLDTGRHSTGVRNKSQEVDEWEKNHGINYRRFNMRGSQASPARPSDSIRMKVKSLTQ